MQIGGVKGDQATSALQPLIGGFMKISHTEILVAPRIILTDKAGLAPTFSPSTAMQAFFAGYRSHSLI